MRTDVNPLNFDGKKRERL